MKILASPIVFNEEKKIGSVLDRFEEGLVDEIAVVDDGSTDNTRKVIESKGAKVLIHEKRSGAGAAIRTAMKYGRKNGFDIIVILAGNDKDRPVEIPRLVDPIVKDAYDFVQGSRYLQGGEYGKMPVYRRLATGYLHPRLFSLISGQKITDSTNGFRAIRLSVLDDERIDLDQGWLDQYELEPFLFYKFIKLGYKVKEVPVTKIYPPKSLGYTKMKPILGWWSILKPLVVLGLGIKK